MTTPNNKPISIEDLHAFKAYLEKNPAGGSLHIVLDDGNVEDSHVEFCIEYARQNGDIEGNRLGKILLGKSKSQRLGVHNRISKLNL